VRALWLAVADLREDSIPGWIAEQTNAVG
jgi:hypothetical protein